MTTKVKDIELKIGSPPEFDGDREESKRFMMKCHAYLDINDKVYDEDKKKIILVLSYMTKGNAAAWAEDFMEAALDPKRKDTAGQQIGYGTWATFKKDFDKAFKPMDPAGTAMMKIQGLEMRGDLHTYISNYRLLTHRAGMSEQAPLIKFFRQGLDYGLQDSLHRTGESLDNFDTVVNTCINLDNAFQRLEAIKRKERPNQQKKKSFGNKHYVPRRSDDMEVDHISRLSDAELKKHLKEGRCFKCHQVGHRANNTSFHPRERDQIRRNKEEESSDDEVESRASTSRKTPIRRKKEKEDEEKGSTSSKRKAPIRRKTTKVEEEDEEDSDFTEVEHRFVELDF